MHWPPAASFLPRSPLCDLLPTVLLHYRFIQVPLISIPSNRLSITASPLLARRWYVIPSTDISHDSHLKALPRLNALSQAIMPSMDYSREGVHSELLIVRGTQPFNAEPRAAALVQFPLTPDDLVYCRNHGPVEDLDRDIYILSIDGTPSGTLRYTMHDLETKFTKHEVVAALQVCH